MGRRDGFSRKERIDELRKGFDTIGKGGTWYLIDDRECKDMGFSGYFKPAAGNVYLVILPRQDSAKFYERIYVHYGIGPRRAAFLCPNLMYDKSCPVCEYRKYLSDKGEPDEVLREFSYSIRVLFWMVNVKDKRAIGDGVFLYDAPDGILKGIIGQIRDDRETQTIIDPSDPEENLEFRFSRTGKGITTKYGAYKIGARQEKIPNEYYDIPVDIDKLLIQPNISDMKSALGVSGGSGREPERDSESGAKSHDRKRESDTGKERDQGDDRRDEGDGRRRFPLSRVLEDANHDRDEQNEKEEVKGSIRHRIDEQKDERENRLERNRDADDMPF